MNINGIEIFVEKMQGTGNLSFVLIHNAGGDHQFFIHQIDALKKLGDVVLVDLPGQGKSGLASDYGMEALALLVAQICKNLSLKNIVFIGLNNGANIIIETVLKHSLDLKAMVLIDPPVFMEEKFISEINDFIQQLENPDFQQFVLNLAEALLSKTDIKNKEIAISAFEKADRKSLQEIFRGLIAWDKNSKGTLKKINCPALCILTDEHHCAYKTLRVEAPQFEIGKVVGSKCWATLEVPEQVNPMIERFLKLLLS